MLPDAKDLIFRVYQTCKKESDRGRLVYSVDKFLKRACALLGIDKHTLQRIVNKFDKSATSSSGTKEKVCSDKTKGKPGPMPSVDSFSKSVIRNACIHLISKNKTLTLKTLLVYLKENNDVTFSKYKLWKALHSIGFRYGKVDQKNMGHLERSDIVHRRTHFLRSIKEHRSNNRPIVYLDETWIDSHIYPQRMWMGEGMPKRKLPSGRGQRFVILHCGSDTGFIDNCSLVFESKANDGRDYHSEMNSNIFKTWVRDQLLPNLPKESVVVMDNASYHSTQVEGTKAPISATKKNEMIQWLCDKGIKPDPKLTKPKLYELIKPAKENLSKQYEVDSLLKEHGHEVLRLPPYHCDLNPIELIWADVKRNVAHENDTFKKTNVKDLIEKSFETVNHNWKSHCEHVKSVENQYWKRDNIQPDRINPIIINLNDDSSDDEDDGEMVSESDGEEDPEGTF